MDLLSTAANSSQPVCECPPAPKLLSLLSMRSTFASPAHDLAALHLSFLLWPALLGFIAAFCFEHALLSRLATWLPSMRSMWKLLSTVRHQPASGVDDAVVAAVQQHMLPSKHGFLPAVVPNFDLGPGFARYVLIADIMYLHYDGSPFEFRTWLQQQLEEVDIQAVARDMETWDAFQKRCGLVPLSFLAHAYRWGTSNPPPEIYAEKEVELPMKLEAPLEVLCDELRIPVGGSITQLFLYNWTLPGHQGGQEYSDADLSVRTMRPRFHFTKDAELQRAETAVFHSVILTESASTQLCRQAIRLFHAVNAGTAGRVAAADSLERISDALKQLLSIFHTIFRQEHISVSAWTNHLQPFYGAITPEGKGVGGLQLPWVHCTDALFAISLDDTIGKLAMENRAYMLPEERSFVSYLETHNQPLLMYLAKTGAESDVAKVFRACINTLVQWRATHRSRAVPYLQPPDNLVRQSTGKLVTYDNMAATFKKLMDQRIRLTSERTGQLMHMAATAQDAFKGRPLHSRRSVEATGTAGAAGAAEQAEATEKLGLESSWEAADSHAPQPSYTPLPMPMQQQPKQGQQAPECGQPELQATALQPLATLPEASAVSSDSDPAPAAASSKPAAATAHALTASSCVGNALASLFQAPRKPAGMVLPFDGADERSASAAAPESGMSAGNLSGVLQRCRPSTVQKDADRRVSVSSGFGAFAALDDARLNVLHRAASDDLLIAGLASDSVHPSSSAYARLASGLTRSASACLELPLSLTGGHSLQRNLSGGDRPRRHTLSRQPSQSGFGVFATQFSGCLDDAIDAALGLPSLSEHSK